MKKVTDLALLQELEGTQPKKVTDPALIAELDGKPKAPNMFALEAPAQAVVDAIGNIPRSATNLVKGVAQAVTHPVETFQGLRSAYRGAIVKALPEGLVDPYPTMGQDVATAEAVGQFYKDRYGGLRNIRDTLIEDPVGAGADIATVTGLAGGALRAGGMTRAADTAMDISRAVDPFYQGAKAVKSVAKPIYKQVVGTSSGAGAKVIDEAFKGNKAFVDAMRGKTPEADVVNMTRDSLDNIRNAKGTAYRQKLATLQNAKQQLPIDDVKALSDDWLKRYNITKNANGELDFSRSTVRNNTQAANEIKSVYETIQDWGSQAGDTTPAGLDILKRAIDDSYTSQNPSRAMTTGLKKAVEKKIVGSVPEYAEMTKDYAKTTELIKEMESALGAGKRTSADTALRKLIMAVKEDKNLRADLLKTLGDAGGQDIMGAAAGVAMSPLVSRSLGSMTTGATAGGAALLLASPKIAALAALASPRLVGELTVLLGKAGRVAPYGRGAGLLAYQAGNIQNQAP